MTDLLIHKREEIATLQRTGLLTCKEVEGFGYSRMGVAEAVIQHGALSMLNRSSNGIFSTDVSTGPCSRTFSYRASHWPS